ncbi:sigma-54-dependent Fis family transcriptional regulator [Motiliproteus sp. MSK22-1]|uniref:sigma-54-dependent Fis family transcriptional regulator n=1 Tax=Motiliproteus sp. MSK22-1 TaxID=1897630 RepID=UPI0009FAEDE7|nr:sigma-54-dependent Fis family transcriptional regulator [Motiliproteus sp. MSK22-1]
METDLMPVHSSPTEPNLTESNQAAPAVIHHVRQLVTDQGVLPAGLLRREIETSWNRCLQQGLRLDQKLELPLLARDELREVRERNNRLISGSVPEMEALCRHFGKRDCIVMLADANATILKTLGESQFSDKASRYSLLPGSSWQESRAGTNAFGTVLKQGKPLMVRGGEHYIDAISGFSCSAAPIYDPFGKIAGVLDVSSYDVLGSCHNLGLVSMSARLIEHRLFLDHYQDSVILAIHPRIEFVGSLWQGLLAFSSDGQLLAANQAAQRCLELGPLAIERDDFISLFGSKLSAVINLSRESVHSPLLLHTTQNLQIHGRLLSGMDGVEAITAEPESSEGLQLKQAQTKQVKQPVRKAHNQGISLAGVTLEDTVLSRSAQRGVKVLNHQIPLLLTGETGAGKEVLARALHTESNRNRADFVALNCAAIPEGLVESELFGYQDGAFTGARRGGMKGKVLLADKGTLFLDEIGDMPLDMQARLLRVLQERSITPLGSGKIIPVDLAIICATHRDLKSMVAQGKFREDLYYRLNGMRIQIPPLRKRSNFVGILEHLLQIEAGFNHGIQIDPLLINKLKSYRWPGNLRQLQTLIKTSLAFMEEGESLISEDHLTEDFLEELNSGRRSFEVNNGADIDTKAPSGTLKNAQTELIKQAIEENLGNISAAALSLGISRATLYRRLQNAGIKRVNDRQVLNS